MLLNLSLFTIVNLIQIMNIKNHIWVAGWVGFKLNPFKRTVMRQWSDLELMTSFQFKSFSCQIPSHQSFKLCKNDHFYFNACLNQTFELDQGKLQG